MRRRLVWGIAAVAVIGLAVLGVLEISSQSQAVQDRLDAVEEELAEAQRAMNKQRPAPEPPEWMVTETQMQRAPGGVIFTISYEAAGGQNRTWRRDVEYGSSTDDPYINAMWECWQSARLGLPLPLCARSGY